jgi:superfamily I DNA/RNA helicase
MLERAAALRPDVPLLVRLGAARSTDRPSTADAPAPDDAWTWADAAAATLAWAAAFHTLEALADAVRDRRRRLAELQRVDARLTLATAHATKGLEFDHVAVIGLEAGRFPSRRTLDEASDPVRALEEERRLAYVAWTRARRSLTLVYDPDAPSPFLLEVFDEAELAAAVPARIDR